MKKEKRKKINRVYVASPLGFSEAGNLYYKNELLPALREFGLIILDPWVLTDAKLIEKVRDDMEFGEEQREAWEKLNKIIGKNNAKGIDKADIIIAVLDGVDVDSGTASEIGYGFAKGKYIEGYRGDFRLSADNIGSTVNLQVEYFIKSSGGKISKSLTKLMERLEEKYIIK